MSIPLIFECNPSPFPVYDVEAEAVEVAEVVAPSGASSSMSSVSRFRGMGSRGKRNPSHAFIGSRKGFRPSYFGVFGALPGSPCQLSAVGPTACPFSHIGESEGKKIDRPFARAAPVVAIAGCYFVAPQSQYL